MYVPCGPCSAKRRYFVGTFKHSGLPFGFPCKPTRRTLVAAPGGGGGVAGGVWAGDGAGGLPGAPGSLAGR